MKSRTRLEIIIKYPLSNTPRMSGTPPFSPNLARHCILELEKLLNRCHFRRRLRQAKLVGQSILPNFENQSPPIRPSHKPVNPTKLNKIENKPECDRPDSPWSASSLRSYRIGGMVHPRNSSETLGCNFGGTQLHCFQHLLGCSRPFPRSPFLRSET